MTTSGLSTAPHAGQRRHRQQPHDLGERDDRAAVQAARRADRAVHLDQRAGARALVQPVDVLRDHGLHPAAVLELGERAVAVVRLRVAEAPRAASRRSPRPSPDRRGTRRCARTPSGRSCAQMPGRRAEVRDARSRC